MTNWCAFPWGRLCLRLRPHEFSLSTSVIYLVQVMFRHPCWQDFTDLASDVSGRSNLTANSLFLSVYNLSIHSSAKMPKPQGTGTVLQVYLLGLNSTTLHFDWLWFYLMVSVAKISFLDEGWELPFSVGRRTKNVVRVRFSSEIYYFTIPEELARFLVPGMIFLLFSGS